MPSIWTQEMLDQLFYMRAEGRTYKWIANELDMTYRQTVDAAKYYRDHNEYETTAFDAEEYDEESPPDWDTLAKLCIEVQEATRSLDPRKWDVEYTTSTSKKTKAVGIVPIGDLHIDNVYSSMRGVVTAFELVAKTPDMYAIGLGDYGDNSIAKPALGGIIADAVFCPRLVGEVLLHLFAKMNGSMIAIASGCHDAWTKSVTGWNFVEQLSKIADCDYVDNQGRLTLHVGDQTYAALIGHKTQRNSGRNPTHGPKSQREDQCADVDWSLFAHKHCSAAQIMNTQPYYKDRLDLLVGGFKPFDSYSIKLGYPHGDTVETNYHPCILARTDRHEFEMCRSIPKLMQRLEQENGSK